MSARRRSSRSSSRRVSLASGKRTTPLRSSPLLCVRRVPRPASRTTSRAPVPDRSSSPRTRRTSPRTPRCMRPYHLLRRTPRRGHQARYHHDPQARWAPSPRRRRRSTIHDVSPVSILHARIPATTPFPAPRPVLATSRRREKTINEQQERDDDDPPHRRSSPSPGTWQRLFEQYWTVYYYLISPAPPCPLFLRLRARCPSVAARTYLAHSLFARAHASP